MMKLKLIAAAAAALFMSGTAQAQKAEWYLLGADGQNTALIFVERFSVSLKGDQATATTLILRVDDSKGEEIAVLGDLAIDCRGRSFKILKLQPLDPDGNRLGNEIPGNGEVISVEPNSFYDGALDFACGGSAKPDPQLLIGNRPPVVAGAKYLRDEQAAKAKQ